MEFVRVQERLAREGLAHPALDALLTDERLYKVLALQPKGDISVSEVSISNKASSEAAEQLTEFLRLAADSNTAPEIAICPEYFAPWSALIALLAAGIRPSRGKLWAIGCESLPIDGLDAVRSALAGVATVIDDAPPRTRQTTQKYVNPLAYIFLTDEIESKQEHLVLLVQYKTKPSGDKANTEIRGMLPGQYVYEFARNADEVRFITLICSDVFDLEDQQIKTRYNGLLLAHIQLNNKPRQPIYKQYRQKLFQYCGDTEVITLNWAEHINFEFSDGTREDAKNIGGSAWYIGGNELDTSDVRLNENHQHGVYYTRHETIRAHALQLNYCPRVFFLETTKVFHRNVIGPMSHRSGPRVLCTYTWEGSAWLKSGEGGENPDDGFGEAISPISDDGVELDDFMKTYAADPMAAERILTLAAGEVGISSKWHDARNMEAMRLCEAEIVRRSTVAQDPEATSIRMARFSAFRAIAELRQSKYKWPPEFSFLENGFEFRWHPKIPSRNIATNDGSVATIIFAGMFHSTDALERFDFRVRRALAGPAPEPNRLLGTDEAKQHEAAHYSRFENICILYTTASSGTKVYEEKGRRSVTNLPKRSSVDFSNPSGNRIFERGRK